jgi:hypothetical protein
MVSLGLFGRSTEPGVHQKQVNGGEDLVSSNDLSLILHLQIHIHHHRLGLQGQRWSYRYPLLNLQPLLYVALFVYCLWDYWWEGLFENAVSEERDT